MQEKVLEVQRRAEHLRGPTTTPLTALKEISEALPVTIKVDIDEFLVNNEMIRVRGNTDSYGSVDAIEAAIKKNPRFAGAEKSDVTKIRAGGTRFMVQSPREPASEEDDG
jgi:hypothetical protein